MSGYDIIHLTTQDTGTASLVSAISQMKHSRLTTISHAVENLNSAMTRITYTPCAAGTTKTKEVAPLRNTKPASPEDTATSID